jgi:dTDP-4-dehydrorhamnose reductase
MRILITGITGLVGRNLADYFCTHSNHSVAGTARALQKPEVLPQSIFYYPLELTNESEVLKTFVAFQPDVVIHSAAMSKPNDCEVQQEFCYDVNVQATKYVADACTSIGCKLIFMSTDFVFGDDGPYAETDAYAPVNYYGQSKVLAEQLVQHSTLHWAIVRTVLVYGKQLSGLSPTFPQWVKGQLEKGSAIRVFTDQFRTATYVLDLVKGIDAIIQQNATGIFHVCGEETFTPYDIACKVATYFNYDTALVQPATRADFAEPARRPIRSTLHITKAKTELGFQPHSFSEALPLIF